MAEPTLLGRAQGYPADDWLLVVLAGMRGANPDLMLGDICRRLDVTRKTSSHGRSL
ncbi:hypothetical protein T8K17_26060 (plasmid) [Thalassobaculum sp. OXR-137]|uniref:hypothetical protein n=1 Tax=Thalassobaculum sp. OXR-137 TaxID=3100173 RepID=UPI002AC902EB|nr:hypothetical protein [Thalassobaculum sp. OXR-137]WPZ37189.1 hypothetical protein T8K17_26060 [Thalassobaculum sp. OXR-137]